MRMKRIKKKKLRFSENMAGYLFISPWIIGFICFIAGPMLYSLAISFTKWEFMKNMRFIGLGNYIKIFTKDRYALPALGKTIYFTLVAVPCQSIIALLLAQLFNNNLKGTKIYRAIIYVPCVVSGAVLGILWSNIYSKDVGVFNYFLAKLGLPKVGWLTDPDIAMFSIILMTFWSVGTAFVMYLSGLQNVPKVYYEAAQIDGAGAFHKFTKVTLPMLSPTILFVLILQVIGSFQVLTQVLVLTNGGPAKSTYVYALYEYENAFKFMKMGYASALSWVMFVIILVSTLLLLFSSKYWVHYEDSRGAKI